MRRSGRKRLTVPPRFSLAYFDPPAALRRYILALFHFAWDDLAIEDRHPGALPQLVLLPVGSGRMQHGELSEEVRSGAHLLAGFTTAAPFVMQGPWHAIGASLSPLGWASLTGQPMNRFLDRLVPAQQLLGSDIEAFAVHTNGLYLRGALSGEDAAFRLAEWIQPRLTRIPPLHERLIEQTIAWLGTSLNPPVEELMARIGYSRRQGERLVERYFGFPPAALARKYRAVRAAALLGEPAITDAQVSAIAEAFYDQPHMVREIRRYCGYTPSRLGGPSDRLFQTMLRMKNFDRLQRIGQADG